VSGVLSVFTSKSIYDILLPVSDAEEVKKVVDKLESLGVEVTEPIERYTFWETSLDQPSVCRNCGSQNIANMIIPAPGITTSPVESDIESKHFVTPTPSSTVGSSIANAMIAYGTISTAEIAENLGITEITVKAWINDSKSPTVSQLIHLATILKVPVCALLPDFGDAEQIFGSKPIAVTPDKSSSKKKDPFAPAAATFKKSTRLKPLPF